MKIEKSPLNLYLEQKSKKTTKPTGKGTGLGLSISYQIVVDKHGGQLKCISAPGQGAEFIIEIPVQQYPQESALFECL